MGKMKVFIAVTLAAASLATAPAAFADREYTLAGGTRAVIEGHRLFLIGEDSKPVPAPIGVYRIRESNQAIYVTVEGVEVRKMPPEIR